MVVRARLKMNPDPYAKLIKKQEVRNLFYEEISAKEKLKLKKLSWSALVKKTGKIVEIKNL